MVKIKIYYLSNPITNDVRYVGQTKQSLKKRLSKHIVDSNTILKKTHNHSWIKSLLNKNLKPEIHLIDIVDEIDWVFWEQHYISLFKSWGFKLNNHTVGGEGKIGIKPWNFNTKGVCKPNSGSIKKGDERGIKTRFKKGSVLGIKTRFKKGRIPHNLGVSHKLETIEKMRNIKLGKISGNRKLTFDDAVKIRELKINGLKIIELMDKFNVSKSTIKNIIYNKTYLK